MDWSQQPSAEAKPKPKGPSRITGPKFHLSTLMIFTFVASPLIWANMREMRTHMPTRDLVEIRIPGFPCDVLNARWEASSAREALGPVEFHYSQHMRRMRLWNMAFCALILAGITGGWEFWLRWKLPAYLEKPDRS